jgi:hypothetical protein
MTTVSTPSSTPGRVSARAPHVYKRHDELVATAATSGPWDDQSIGDVVELIIRESTAFAPTCAGTEPDTQRGRGGFWSGCARILVRGGRTAGSLPARTAVSAGSPTWLVALVAARPRHDGTN